jgi:hypothetical protein
MWNFTCRGNWKKQLNSCGLTEHSTNSKTLARQKMLQTQHLRETEVQTKCYSSWYVEGTIPFWCLDMWCVDETDPYVILFCCSFNDAVGISIPIVTHFRWVVNEVLQRMWNKAFVAQFKDLESLRKKTRILYQASRCPAKNSNQTTPDKAEVTVWVSKFYMIQFARNMQPNGSEWKQNIVVLTYDLSVAHNKYV